MTPFDHIRDRFLSKIADNDLLSLDEEDINIETDMLLRAACGKFLHCHLDLAKRNLTDRYFEIPLNDTEIEILSLLMVNEWLSPKLHRQQLLRQSLSNRDYQMTSQANHLLSLKELKEHNQKELDSLISVYYYSNYEREEE
ncbi:hypothetical protein [Bacillus sp. Marseille-P3800]|uniref:hypothetical protein n=1 Tax=Bacillus sp. Marseille-P3800 TaxID=2014782 RepID=UPI000C07DB8A|nr:hypothetical protein [Bacillus sp. Marseille-P3800]